MVRIAFDLRGPRHVTFNQNSAGDAAERHSSRVKQRLAGDDLLWLSDVRTIFWVGSLVQPVSPANAADAAITFSSSRRSRVAPDRWPVRELVLRVLPKFGRIGKLLQAAPKPGSISLARCVPKRRDVDIWPRAVLFLCCINFLAGSTPCLAGTFSVKVEPAPGSS